MALHNLGTQADRRITDPLTHNGSPGKDRTMFIPDSNRFRRLIVQFSAGLLLAEIFAVPVTHQVLAAPAEVGSTTTRPVVYHKTAKIDGLDIFYREAGPKDAPTVLLLHGFPTSSHMFRNLIPALADR